MIEIIDKKDCCGCSACQSICPKSCISMQADSEGFLYPVVDKSQCIECNRCVDVCPVLKSKEIDRTKTAYAAYNKDEKTRMSSSSGGIFTLIATHVINMGGVVFGAAFDEQFNVVHKAIRTIAELSELRTSKYTQSMIGETYLQAKNYLNQGLLVLFTGTACQINGLYSYLGKEYENLITQDLICHGVPSPAVWQKYLSFCQSKASSYPKKVSFRDKHFGWKRFSMAIEYSDKKREVKDLNTDLMMKAFLNDLCLRPACYDCGFRAGGGTHYQI